MAEHDKQLLSALAGLGLSEHESLVYLTALSLGPATVLQIARTSGLKRTTIYYVLENLKKTGLITMEVRGLKQRFVAENPEKLVRVIEQRRLDLKELLPEFAARYNMHGGESTLKYYEGLPAIESVYESMLRDIKPKEDYLVMSDAARWAVLDPEFFQKFRERRGKMNIRRRLLVLDNEGGREFQKFGKNYGEEVKLLPPGTNLVTNLVIIPRRVMIHQMTPPIMAIVIENPSVIQMHQQTFEMLWQSLPV